MSSGEAWVPVIRLCRKRLEEIIGLKLADEEFEDIFFRTKCEVSPLDDEYIEVEVTNDRLDMLMSEGIARVVRGLLGLELGMPKYETYDSGLKLEVHSSVRKVRPYIATAVIRGVHIDEYMLEEIIQLQEKIHTTLGRGRKKIAIGIHNYDVIRGRKLIYKAMGLDEFSFKPLYETRVMTGREILVKHEKGREYGWIIRAHNMAPVIVVEETGDIIAMPPIINSDLTRVEPGTKNLFIDITGIDEAAVYRALDLVATTIAESAGRRIGRVEICSGQRTIRTPLLQTSKTVFSIAEAERVIGVELSPETVVDLLLRARYDVSISSGMVEAEAPPYRYDILHKIDVIEDMAISMGYNEIPIELPTIYTTGRELRKTAFLRAVRNLMVGLGFQEILTYMLSSPEDQLEFLEDAEGVKLIELENPVVSYMSCLRARLLPIALRVLGENQYKEHPIKIFETGITAFLDRENRINYTLRLCAGVLAYAVSLEDVHSPLFALAENMGWRIALREYKHSAFIDGRTAEIILNGEPRGIIGEVHPSILEKYNIEYPVALFELDLSGLWKE